MNRRNFLAHVLAAVPVIVASEQLLELLAPKRTIFLPPWGGYQYPITDSVSDRDRYLKLLTESARFPERWTVAVMHPTCVERKSANSVARQTQSGETEA